MKKIMYAVFLLSFATSTFTQLQLKAKLKQLLCSLCGCVESRKLLKSKKLLKNNDRAAVSARQRTHNDGTIRIVEPITDETEQALRGCIRSRMCTR